MTVLLPAIAAAQPGCYNVPTAAIALPAASRQATFLIYKQPECAWFVPPAGNVIGNANWITIQDSTYWGYGNAGVFAFVTAKNSGAARTGTISAVGSTFTVRQSGATDWPPISGAAAPGLASLDALMTNAMLEFDVPGGVLAVTYKGRLVYARGFGTPILRRSSGYSPTRYFNCRF